MNRRSFLKGLGVAVIALNVTLGFRPSTVIKEELKPTRIEDDYRMVVPMTAAEDVKPGDFVARQGECVRPARMEDAIFGIAEGEVKKGGRVFICTSGITYGRSI